MWPSKFYQRCCKHLNLPAICLSCLLRIEYLFFFFFFFRGHGNESCNLIGSSPGQYFSLATVTLSWVAEYIPTFVAIFHKYISFFRLGSIFKQTRRSLPQADKQLLNPLFFLSQITLVDKKMLVSEWICISNSIIKLVEKRPKNRLQLILIVHRKYLES